MEKNNKEQDKVKGLEKKTKRKKIYEIFKIEKKKKSKKARKDSKEPKESLKTKKTRDDLKKSSEEKIIKAQGIEEQKIATKDQIKHQNKLLRNFLIGIGILTFVFILVILSIYSSKNFEYRGIKFDVIREGNVIFYHTSFPIILNEQKVNYNVYLRNDPRKLEYVPFKGNLNLLEMIVINNTESFVCEGDGGIAMYNFQQILRIFGITLMKDPEADCDSEGRYVFIKIQPGDTTSIEQTGPACYNLYVNDCEILKVTEKFLIEALIQKIGE